MQAELNADPAAGSRLPIVISGINAAGHESFNTVIVENRTIPWLQDTGAQDVWGTWRVNEARPEAPGIEWRDLVVLDAENRVISVYNLTDPNDLARPSVYQLVKDMLVNAATPAAR